MPVCQPSCNACDLEEKRMTIERRRLRRCSAHGLATLAIGGVFAALACTIEPTFAQQQPATPNAAGKAKQPPSAANAPPPQGPEGIWIDHTGRGAVAIEPCTTGEPGLCGRIVWMQEPRDKAGQLLRDTQNESRKLRDRPICGLQIIGNLKPMRDGSWDGGWIYDPEQGERFDVELRLRAPNVLQVKGYKGLKFLSETFQWKRAETALVPCPPANGPV